MKWRKITEKIIALDGITSVEGFEPSQQDIADILAMNPDAAIGIAGQPVMVFENGSFKESIGFFEPSLPGTANDRLILNAMRKLGDFTVDQLAMELYPEIYMRKKAFRLSRMPDIWAPDKSSLAEHYPGEKIEPYDYKRLATARAGNYVYSNFKEKGWIVQNSNNTWRICSSILNTTSNS